MVEKYNIKDTGEFRENKKNNNFKTRKNNTLKSLREVECFLYNWRRVLKGIKIYKILK